MNSHYIDLENYNKIKWDIKSNYGNLRIEDSEEDEG